MKKYDVIYEMGNEIFKFQLKPIFILTGKNEIIKKRIIEIISKINDFHHGSCGFNFTDLEFYPNEVFKIYLDKKMVLKISNKIFWIKIDEFPNIKCFYNLENNLHPYYQHSKLKELVSIRDNVWLIISTNSPYILTTLNNLIIDNLLHENSQTESIIPKNMWIKPDEINAYDLESRKSIIDKETGFIIADEIDRVSDIICDETDKLMNLRIKNEIDD